MDGVWYEVFELVLEFLCVFEDGLGVFLRHFVCGVVSRLFDLLDLLGWLELDEEDDGVNLVGVKPLDSLKANLDDAVLVLELKQRN